MLCPKCYSYCEPEELSCWVCQAEFDPSDLCDDFDIANLIDSPKEVVNE